MTIGEFWQAAHDLGYEVKPEHKVHPVFAVLGMNIGTWLAGGRTLDQALDLLLERSAAE